MLRTFFDKFSSSISYLFLFKNVEGSQNLPEIGFIAAANHSSYLDIWIMECVTVKEKRRYVRFLAKKELKKDSHVGFLKKFYITEKSTPIFMDRTKFDKEAFTEAIKALNNGDIIGMFPEGGRTESKSIGKGKTGAVRLAVWSKKPIVPIGIKGAFDLMPHGKKFPSIRKKIEVKIGKPIYFDKYYNKELTKEILEKETENLMHKISELSGVEYKP